jgi:hypothetical protein
MDIQAIVYESPESFNIAGQNDILNLGEGCGVQFPIQLRCDGHTSHAP